MANLTISWTAPGSCAGCTYEYRYKLSTDTTYITGGTSNTSIVISSLTDGATYNYGVRTVCGSIRSAWSSAATVTCDSEPPLTATPTPTPTSTPTPTPTGAPTSTPTPTPTPTATATPTPTPTTTLTSYCVRLTLGSLENGTTCSYDKYKTATVTLYDATGTNIVNAPSNIDIVLEVYTDGIFSPVTITIPSGQSSGSDDIYLLVWDDCGERNSSTSSTIDGIWSTPSNITECVTPTPTPTSTPVYLYYRASEILWDNVGTTYCTLPGYTMTGPLYSSSATFIPGSTVLYTDYGLQDTYVGQWTNSSDYRFAYITQSQHEAYLNYPSYPNTYDPDADGNMGGIFKWAGVDASGVVQTSGTYSCSSGSGGTE
jgi:hypothetical protein